MTFTSRPCDWHVPSSALVRWCKFNLVGGIGILVQLGTLFVLKSVLHFNYFAATAIAVEAAVAHNFVWHEQFTWRDRTKSVPGDQSSPSASGAEARVNFARAYGAARSRALSRRRGRLSKTFARLLRFHLGNGAVSIFGNLALMKGMVGLGRMNYLVANAIAIGVCSAANFVVSEAWVFGRE
jgi:putative flippase GtrA